LSFLFIFVGYPEGKFLTRESFEVTPFYGLCAFEKEFDLPTVTLYGVSLGYCVESKVKFLGIETEFAEGEFLGKVSGSVFNGNTYRQFSKSVQMKLRYKNYGFLSYRGRFFIKKLFAPYVKYGFSYFRVETLYPELSNTKDTLKKLSFNIGGGARVNLLDSIAVMFEILTSLYFTKELSDGKIIDKRNLRNNIIAKLGAVCRF
jgi:opacity protein-like surface antigen